MAEEKELRYDPAAIEPKWQQRWAADPALYAADPVTSGKPKYYVLEMLPYPSGQLHMGHVRNYSIGDALARHMWMRGYNVLHPMGWDAFGLPAENAALKNNTPPRQWTLANIAGMKRQFSRLGMGFDWATEVTTCFPDYYRWNQWFFLRMYERGLVYRKKSKVNWCPECCTVLANEQVIDGRCWRHEDTIVEQRDLEQWFLRITAYAQELLDGLDKLDGWPEKVRTMQRNWIGRSEGTEVDFFLAEDAVNAQNDDGSPKVIPAGRRIRVFTTRVDTIFGATSVQLAPEHPLVTEMAANDAGLAKQVAELLEEQKQRPRSRRRRRHRKARRAHRPLRHQSLQRRTRSHLGRQLHPCRLRHRRHHERARPRRARLRIREQVRHPHPPRHRSCRSRRGRAGAAVHHRRRRTHQLRRVQRSGLCRRNQETSGSMPFAADSVKPKITFRLKDWGVSRQRYWGTPIPMIHCERDGIVPVPDDQLPVILPDNIEITQTGGSPLARIPEFVNVTCPKCGGPANARPTPWTPSSTPAGTSTATPTRTTTKRHSTPPS